MLVNIKVGKETLYNVPIKEAIEHFNTPKEELIPQILEKKQEELFFLQKKRLQIISDQYGYNGLADIDFYARRKDKEAKALLDWYEAYDDLIWNWIDNELSKITDLEQLLKLDMKQIEEQIFQASIKENPLP